MKEYTLDEVYGISRDLPLNYVARQDVDQVFVDSLARAKHIVVHGSSKQGKTSLRKHCLNDEDYVVISCLNTMGLEDLHAAILKGVGYRVEQTQTRTVGGHFKYNVEFKGKGKVPFVVEAEGGGGLEGQHDRSTQTASARLELELVDVNDIIAALTEIEFNKFIILEDFHYLPVETQKNFSFALKSFHENSKFTFIVIGVWREKNRLVYYNGDLTDRVISVDADRWAPSDLSQVVNEGAKLLNVIYDSESSAKVIEGSSDAVYLVQEACRIACQSANVYRTTIQAPVTVGAGLNASETLKTVVEQQSGRYSAFITNFAEGFQATDLEMYKWILFSVLTTPLDVLESGLRRSQIAETLREHHPAGKKLNPGNLSQALQSMASLQVQKSIRPIIIDYDQTTRTLNIVDRSFLTWLSYQDVEEILKEMDIET